jgi:hypothetical protein
MLRIPIADHIPAGYIFIYVAYFGKVNAGLAYVPYFKTGLIGGGRCAPIVIACYKETLAVNS